MLNVNVRFDRISYFGVSFFKLRHSRVALLTVQFKGYPASFQPKIEKYELNPS